jgi:hypothetical protein
MSKSSPDLRNGTEKRLDALLWLFIEINKNIVTMNKGKKFTEGDVARLLKSMDLTPTEIAKIMGKKSASDISVHLYAKKKEGK